MIVVFPTEFSDGQGDMALMLYMANVIIKSKKIHPKVLFVVENKHVLARVREKAEANGIEVITIRDFNERVSQPGPNQIIPSLLIEGPVYVKGRGFREGANPTIPILYTFEYSTGDTLVSGGGTLDKIMEAGSMYKVPCLNFNTGLLSGNKIAEKQNYMAKPLVRRIKENNLYHLPEALVEKHLDDNTEKGIITYPSLFNYRDQLSVSEVLQSLPVMLKQNLFVGDINPENYFSNKTMFLEYSHDGSSLEKFLKLLMQLSNSPNYQKKSIDLISLGKKVVYSNQGEECDIIKLIMKHEATLGQAGFTSIEVIQEGSLEVIRLAKNPANEKILRVHNYDGIPRNDFINLASISEMFVGVTGDQSFTEILSLGKVPVYEVRAHKSRFIDGFNDLARQLNCEELAKFIEAHSNVLESRKKSKINPESLDFQAIDTKQLENQLIKVRSYIAEHYNLAKNLEQTVNRLLVYRNPTESYLPPIKKRLIEQIDIELNKLSKIRSLSSSDKVATVYFTELKGLMKCGYSIRDAANHPDMITNRSVSPQFWAKNSKEWAVPKFVSDAINEEAQSVSSMSISDFSHYSRDGDFVRRK